MITKNIHTTILSSSYQSSSNMNVQFTYPDHRPENIVRYVMLINNKVLDVLQQAAHKPYNANNKHNLLHKKRL